MLPGTLFDVYLGSLGTTAAAGDEAIAAEWTVRAIGLVAAIAVTGCVAWLARQVIAERTQSGRRSDTRSQPARLW